MKRIRIRWIYAQYLDNNQWRLNALRRWYALSLNTDKTPSLHKPRQVFSNSNHTIIVVHAILVFSDKCMNIDWISFKGYWLDNDSDGVHSLLRNDFPTSRLSTIQCKNLWNMDPWSCEDCVVCIMLTSVVCASWDVFLVDII
jgi:hypothetical protein